MSAEIVPSRVRGDQLPDEASAETESLDPKREGGYSTRIESWSDLDDQLLSEAGVKDSRVSKG